MRYRHVPVMETTTDKSVVVSITKEVDRFRAIDFFLHWVWVTKKIPVCQSKKENFGFGIKLLSFLHYAF